jgi:N4-gp56 family major capsid protein
MSITTTVNLATMVQQEVLPVLLSRPMPNLIYSIPAMSKSLKGRSGTTLREGRYENAPTVPVPLGPSGLTPPPLNLVRTQFDSQINFYGAYYLITNQVTLLSIEDVLNEGGSLLGQCMKETKDQLLRDMLSSTPSKVQAVLGSNGDYPTNLTADDIQNVVNALLTASAMQFTRTIPGENKIGTSPILPSYLGLGHTNLIGGLRKTNGFVPSSSYPRSEDIFQGEYGTSGYVRTLLSPRGKIIPGASRGLRDVYDFAITGREAYQHVKLDNYSSNMYYTPSGAGNDYLRQRQAIAMTFASAERAMNDLWFSVLQCTLPV